MRIGSGPLLAWAGAWASNGPLPILISLIARRILSVSVRHHVLVAPGFLALALMLAACQMPALTKPAFPENAAVSATTPSSTVALGLASAVWGKVPYCTCLSGKATANVSTALEKAHLAGTVKEDYPTGGWMYFVVTFDPRGASRDQIASAITAGGGQIVTGPP
jgi:hypothetical protein